jgi:hypothetical protein
MFDIAVDFVRRSTKIHCSNGFGLRVGFHVKMLALPLQEHPNMLHFLHPITFVTIYLHPFVEELSCITGVYFNPKWDNVAGGQATFVYLNMPTCVRIRFTNSLSMELRILRLKSL